MICADELIRSSALVHAIHPHSPIVAVLDGIVRELPAMLTHREYEIRRVADQILPNLARAAVLSGSSTALHTDIPSTGTTDIAIDSQLICKAVWVSEIAKAAQHIQEVIKSEEIMRIGDWVMNLPGRLTEEETTRQFRHLLQQLKEAEDEGLSARGLKLCDLLANAAEAIVPWISFLSNTP